MMSETDFVNANSRTRLRKPRAETATDGGTLSFPDLTTWGVISIFRGIYSRDAPVLSWLLTASVVIAT
jgi:hypothetical protein